MEAFLSYISSVHCQQSPTADVSEDEKDNLVEEEANKVENMDADQTTMKDVTKNNTIVKIMTNSFETLGYTDFKDIFSCYRYRNYVWVYALAWKLLNMKFTPHSLNFSDEVKDGMSNDKELPHFSVHKSKIYMPKNDKPHNRNNCVCIPGTEMTKYSCDICREFVNLLCETLKTKKIENNSIKSIVKWRKNICSDFSIIYAKTRFFFKFCQEHFCFVFLLDFLFITTMLISGLKFSHTKVTLEKHLLPSRDSYETNNVQVTKIDNENLVVVPKIYQTQSNFESLENIIFMSYFKYYEKYSR